MANRMPRTGRVEVEVSATPEQIWDVLSDVTRIGEWSHECTAAQWLDDADHAAVGARFRGTNKRGLIKWSRPCTFTELEPRRRLAYRTDGGVMGDATEWTFSLEATETGCRIVQTCNIISLPRVAEWLILKMMPQHLDRTAALREDLEQLGRAAAGRKAEHGAGARVVIPEQER